MCALLLIPSGLGCDPALERVSPAATAASATTPPTTAATNRLAATSDVGAAGEDPAIGELASLEPTTPHSPAALRGRTAAGRTVQVHLATRPNPKPHRGALALYRLARALHLTVVPPTAARRLPIARLTTLLEKHPEALAEVRQHALVGNDGAVLALLQGECVGRQRYVGLSEPTVPWSEWARSPTAPSGRAGQTARDYVQWATVDYLAGNVERRFVRIDEATGRLCLDDNDSAFPGTIGADATDLLLRRLRPVARFPAQLAARLQHFDRTAARQALQRGRFEDWLLGPRELVDLHERRSTLLTLVAARRSGLITPE